MDTFSFSRNKYVLNSPTRFCELDTKTFSLSCLKFKKNSINESTESHLKPTQINIQYVQLFFNHFKIVFRLEIYNSYSVLQAVHIISLSPKSSSENFQALPVREFLKLTLHHVTEIQLN